MQLDYFPSAVGHIDENLSNVLIERLSHTADYNENINMHTQPRTDYSAVGNCK